MGFPRSAFRPLSTPPMRRPRPPASTTPVIRSVRFTPDAGVTLREHCRTDGFDEALFAREKQVVLVYRAADHRDADACGDLVTHLREPRARDEKRDLHLRGLDHHLGRETAGCVKDL